MQGALLSLLCLAGSAVAAPHARWNYAVKEVHNPPGAWRKVAAAPADHVMSISIGLKQHRFSELENHLTKSSDPSHKKYGAHLSAEEVRKLVQPSDETSSAVHEWLAQHGIESESLTYSPARDWISVRLPLEKVEQLLDTEYAVYEHSEDGDMLVRTPEWSLPRHLHEHIDVVQPTNSFFRPEMRIKNALSRRDKLVKEVDTFPLAQNTVAMGMDVQVDNSNPDISKVCNETFVTPTCLRTLYGTIDYKPQALDKNHVGINNFLGEVNNRSDTNLFLKQFRPEAAGAGNQFKTIVINNGNNYQGQENATRLAAGADIEGDLDSETVLGVAWPTRLTTYNTGGSPPFVPDLNTPTDTNEPYLDWVNAVLAMDDLPYTISTSYADDEQTVPFSYANRACNGFAQLGARGISLFFGSGDYGVGKTAYCYTNDGKNTSSFLAEFPTTCPYVTAVGATKQFNPEVVAVDNRNGFVSGGGFSNYFSRPKYQKQAVDAYVKSLGTQFEGLYNKTGRGYPDVAAQGYRFAVVWNGTVLTVDGTSASTPLFTAVITLVNDALLASGKPTLGFLNPWLYAEGYKALTDVTIGSAIGCGGSGFPATKGWDAVTGFGTPIFKKLVDSAKQFGDSFHSKTDAGPGV